MPMKDWLNRFQPLQLYIILFLSICYFLAQLFLSHITHALTLLVNSYHMLCNILALTGCILMIKVLKPKRRSYNLNAPMNIRVIAAPQILMSEENSSSKFRHSKKQAQIQRPSENGSAVESASTSSKDETKFVELCIEMHPDENRSHNHKLKKISSSPGQEAKLKNTFGWTRIDVLTMLIVCIFLSSLSFSLLVEALQTLVHIDHQDTMHHPIPVLILGGIGLVLNGVCYLVIGGYTMHQGSFLHITSTGDVVLNHVTVGSTLKPKERRLSKTKRDQLGVNLEQSDHKVRGKRQGLVEMFRDICSTLFVIVSTLIVYFADSENVSKFVDPIMSIISCVLLLILSYPYMKESCLILLQTIPASIDIEVFKKNLLLTFKDIVSVHDLHIWQLTASKYVSTAHILFQNPKVYAAIMHDVQEFFHEQGITIVTIQPEFTNTNSSSITYSVACLVRCQDPTCVDKHCCKSTIEEALNQSKIVQQQETYKSLYEQELDSHAQKENEFKIPSNWNISKKSKSVNDLTQIVAADLNSNKVQRNFTSESKLYVENRKILSSVEENAKKKTEPDNSTAGCFTVTGKDEIIEEIKFSSHL